MMPAPTTTTPSAEPPAPSLFSLATDPREVANGLTMLKQAAAATLDASDITSISNRPFVRKSGWQKLALVFGIHTTIAGTERTPLGTTGDAAWRVTVRASKLACSVERSGLCTLTERKGTPPEKVEAVALAMAETRAAGRAISALFGFGDITAEEAATVSPDQLTTISPVGEAVQEAHGSPSSSSAARAAATPSSGPSGPTPAQIAECKAFGISPLPTTAFDAATALVAKKKELKEREKAAEEKQAAAAAPAAAKPAPSSPSPAPPKKKAKPAPKDKDEKKDDGGGECSCGSAAAMPYLRADNDWACRRCDRSFPAAAAKAVLAWQVASAAKSGDDAPPPPSDSPPATPPPPGDETAANTAPPPKPTASSLSSATPGPSEDQPAEPAPSSNCDKPPARVLSAEADSQPTGSNKAPSSRTVADRSAAEGVGDDDDGKGQNAGEGAGGEKFLDMLVGKWTGPEPEANCTCHRRMRRPVRMDSDRAPPGYKCAACGGLLTPAEREYVLGYWRKAWAAQKAGGDPEKAPEVPEPPAEADMDHPPTKKQLDDLAQAGWPEPYPNTRNAAWLALCAMAEGWG